MNPTEPAPADRARTPSCCAAAGLQPRRPLRHRHGRRGRPRRLGRLARAPRTPSPTAWTTSSTSTAPWSPPPSPTPTCTPPPPGSRSPASTCPAADRPGGRAGPHRARTPPPAPATGSCSATAGTRPRWPERRPPTRAELDAATGGRPLYLTRVDVHSAARHHAPCSTSSPASADLPGFDRRRPADPRRPPRGARAPRTPPSPPAQRAEAQRAALRHAASLGIGALHECAGPDISCEDDLTALLALAADGARAAGHRLLGRAVRPPPHDLDRIRDLGAVGAARRPVRRRLPRLPHRLPARALRRRPAHRRRAPRRRARSPRHVAVCTEAGVQAGFHAIGDAAIDAVVAGVRAAAERSGTTGCGPLRHRVEHAEMLTERDRSPPSPSSA